MTYSSYNKFLLFFSLIFKFIFPVHFFIFRLFYPHLCLSWVWFWQQCILTTCAHSTSLSASSTLTTAYSMNIPQVFSTSSTGSHPIWVFRWWSRQQITVVVLKTLVTLRKTDYFKGIDPHDINLWNLTKSFQLSSSVMMTFWIHGLRSVMFSLPRIKSISS